MLKAANPKFALYEDRLPTFKVYSQAKYPMSATSLCEAGFFYEGPRDKVRCFWCDGALEMWEEQDEPWRDHAK